MKSFLCALDFNAGAGNFLNAAVDLTVESQAHLTILFPYRLLPVGNKDEAQGLKKKIVDQTLQKFSALESELNLAGKVSYEFKPEIGFLSDCIELRIRKHQVDMVILSFQQANTVDEAKGCTIKKILIDLNVPFQVLPDKG